MDQSNAAVYVENANPFNVIVYVGGVTLDPAADNWTEQFISTIEELNLLVLNGYRKRQFIRMLIKKLLQRLTERVVVEMKERLENLLRQLQLLQLDTNQNLQDLG